MTNMYNSIELIIRYFIKFYNPMTSKYLVLSIFTPPYMILLFESS